LILGVGGGILRELWISFDLKHEIPDLESQLTSNNDNPPYKLLTILPNTKAESTAKAMAGSLVGNKAKYDLLALQLLLELESRGKEKVEGFELIMKVVPVIEKLQNKKADDELRDKLKALTEKVSNINI